MIKGIIVNMIFFSFFIFFTHFIFYTGKIILQNFYLPPFPFPPPSNILPQALVHFIRVLPWYVVHKCGRLPFYFPWCPIDLDKRFGNPATNKHRTQARRPRWYPFFCISFFRTPTSPVPIHFVLFSHFSRSFSSFSHDLRKQYSSTSKAYRKWYSSTPNV